LTLVRQTDAGKQWDDDSVLVPRKDLDKMQQVVRTMKSLLPQILNQELLNAVASAQSLELGTITLSSHHSVLM